MAVGRYVPGKPGFPSTNPATVAADFMNALGARGTCFGVPCAERVSAEEELGCAWWDMARFDHGYEAWHEGMLIADVLGPRPGNRVPGVLDTLSTAT